MRQMPFRLVRFLKREDGPTAVEYAVMFALMVIACVAMLITLGRNSGTDLGSGTPGR
jgi:pilus assembly protein Flp/PilA